MTNSYIPTVNRIIKVLSILLLCSALSLFASQKKLYKWIDTDGTVKYSDVLPPAAASKKRDILNNKGFTIEKIDRAKTPGELAKEEKLQKAETRKKRLAIEQAKRDKELLRVYHSEKDIIRSRDSKVNAIKYNITLEKDSIATHRENIASLRKSVSEYERAGRPIPARLKTKISKARLMIMRVEDVIARKRLKQNKTEKKYELILARYRFLVNSVEKH